MLNRISSTPQQGITVHNGNGKATSAQKGQNGYQLPVKAGSIVLAKQFAPNELKNEMELAAILCKVFNKKPNNFTEQDTQLIQVLNEVLQEKPHITGDLSTNKQKEMLVAMAHVLGPERVISAVETIKKGLKKNQNQSTFSTDRNIPAPKPATILNELARQCWNDNLIRKIPN